jgi:hypothetical protein
VSGRKPRQTVRPGDKIRMTYKGLVYSDNMPVHFAEIDNWFWVMSTTETVSDSGLSLGLEVNTIDRHIEDTVTQLVGALEAVDVRNVSVQTFPFWSENTWLDTIQGSNAITDREYKEATFKLQLDNSVVDVTAVKIRFKTKPLYVLNSFTTGLPEAYSEMFYCLINSPNHPYQVRMFINGQDVTSTFGGPWNDLSVDADGGIDCDISDYIITASGGIYQEHTIIFKAANRVGDAAVGTPSTIQNINSNGFVELNIRVLGVAQAILPS